MSAIMFLAVLVAMAIPSGVEVPADNCIAQISEDARLKLQVCLPKKEFSEGEPILAKFTLINRSNAPQRLGEPASPYSIVGFEVRQVSGETPLPPRLLDLGPAAPTDYGWEFRPWEARNSYQNLQAYSETIPVGLYAVKGCYHSPFGVDGKWVEGIWQGRIETPELPFSVVKPTGRDAEASKLFLEATRKVKGTNKTEALEAAETFRELADPEKGGVFAQYAPYFEALALSRSHDRERGMTALLDYAERHPDAHPYAEWALTVVGSYLYSHGRYSAARSIFQKLPKGYDRMDWLRRCDEKLAEQESGKQ